MPSSRTAVDIVPVLSRGRHRSPRSGACFMEYASYLAGQRWSDHPPCTHPALAAVARLVNDWTSDASRSRLAPLIPSVVGVTTGRPLVEVAIALRVAVEAFPVVDEERQRLLAIGMTRAIGYLGDTAPLEHGRYAPMVRAALDLVPHAERWAVDHIAAVRPQRLRSASPMCDAMVAMSVAGIGEAHVADRDERLRLLLTHAIAEFSIRDPAETAPTPADRRIVVRA